MTIQPTDIATEISQGQEDWAFTLGVQAFIWGYPMVCCWQDRLDKLERAGGEVNTFRHRRQIAAPGDEEYVNAGSDFLYSTAVLDLTDGPVVIAGADFGNRWYGVQVLDAYMETVCNLGARTMGSSIVPTVLLCPSDADTVVEGCHTVRCDSSYLYVVARIALQADDDLAAVHRLQDGLTITPYQSDRCVGGGVATTPSHGQRLPRANDCPDELRFFADLGEVLKFAPARPGEAMFAGQLERLGICAERAFEAASLSPAAARGLARAIPHASGILERKKFEIGERVNGWTLVRDIGNYGCDYITRALVARHGPWANVPQESLYLMAMTDETFAPLHGLRDYEIRFTPQLCPRVDAFWSVSYYDAAGAMVATGHRGAINSNDSDLRYESDGTLTIRIGRNPPPADPPVNWLCSHDGPFVLNLRCYQPAAQMLDGSFSLPPVRACNAEAM